LWLDLIQDYEADHFDSKGHLWGYYMVDAVTRLQPRFRLAYVLGANTISLLHDTEGARLLFERGLQIYPNDWVIAYRAGYHYLYEVKDCKRAAEIFDVAVKNGAPMWVDGLVSRLYSAEGQFDIAKQVVLQGLKTYKDNPRMVEYLRKRLEEIEKQDPKIFTETVLKLCVKKAK